MNINIICRYSPYVLESIKILIDKEEKGNSDDGSEKLAVIQGLHDAIDRMTEWASCVNCADHAQ